MAEPLDRAALSGAVRQLVAQAPRIAAQSGADMRAVIVAGLGGVTAPEGERYAHAMRTVGGLPSDMRDRARAVANAAVWGAYIGGVPLADLYTVGHVETRGADFDPRSGLHRGPSNPALGTWQQKPRYVAAYWPVPQDLQPDPEGSERGGRKVRTANLAIVNDLGSSGIAMGRWWRHRLRRAEQIARMDPPGMTYRARAAEYPTLLRQKETLLREFLEEPIIPGAYGPTPYAHYNRGSNGLGRWPQMQAPNRADGSNYETSARRTVSRARDAMLAAPVPDRSDAVRESIARVLAAPQRRQLLAAVESAPWMLWAARLLAPADETLRALAYQPRTPPGTPDPPGATPL